MRDSKIRIGVIGAGANTRSMHIPRLSAIDGVEIVSVCNRSLDSGRRVAEAFGIGAVHRHWTETIEDEGSDAIVIGTWPYLHAPAACAALRAGKHVLVEARMAMNAAEARLMFETARERPDLVAQVVPSPFTLPFDRTIAAFVGDGYLGEIYAIDLRGCAATFAERAAPMTWRQNIDLSGLNTLGMGIWYEALARWVGHARKVMAMRKVCVKCRPDGAGGVAAIRVPDHVDVLAEMDCGAQAHMRFSAVTGLIAPATGAWLYGSDGTLALDMDGRRLLGARRGETELQELPIPGERQGRWQVEEDFIASIREGAPVRLTSFSEGLKYMEFTEAVARSAERGEAVALPLL